MWFKKSFLLLALMFISASLFADEGMWLLNDAPMYTLHRAGLKLNADQLYNPDASSWSDAVVQIGGGTGSFVSKDGLVVTNHHVAYDALQLLSTDQHNYTKDGYEATSRSEELYAKGYKAYLALRWDDVTDQVLANVTSDMTPAERKKAIDEAINEIEAKAAANASDMYRFEVSTFDTGLKYYLFKYMKFEDIRLVYAPPASIGRFGGDIDNWMWPRHDGDFSFFRFYISPDGKSTKYNKNNVPFHPKKFLSFSEDGVKKGDFNFIIGYPGGTERHRTSYSVNYYVNTIYPFRISYYTDALNILNTAIDDNESLQITYANTLASLNNYLKNYKGMLAGIKRDHLLRRKQRMEDQLLYWMNQEKSRQEKYGNVLPGIAAVYAQLDSINTQSLLLNAMNRLTEIYNIASTLDKWSIEKTKPNQQRENRFTEQHLPSIKEHFKLVEKEYTPKIDAQLMEYFLNRLIRLPHNLQLKPVQDILAQYPNADTSAAIHQFVQSLYQHTVLKQVDQRLKIFNMSRDEMKSLDDPMLNFAMSLRPAKDRIRAFDDNIDGELYELRPQFIEASRQWRASNNYPDANFTPRLTYGEVMGYSPRDAVYYDYITSIRGILEKNTGKPPFNSPQKLLDLLHRYQQPAKYIDQHIDTVPVDFLNNTDITGGNSGSPVMDSQGRFVGIAFDGNWESISADWVFNPDLTRAISVDARYILYILDNFANSHYVLNELTIE